MIYSSWKSDFTIQSLRSWEKNITFSTLLQKHCNKKQETEECILKIGGYIYHQGTYTPEAGTEKGAGFLPFTGVSHLYMWKWFNFVIDYLLSTTGW